MNPLLITGTALSWALAGLLATSPETEFLAILVAALAAVQLTGLCLIAAGKARAGGLTVFWGGALMLPLGLIAAFGARRVLDEQALNAFEARRAIA